MTLEAWSWLAIFAIGFGFLCVTAYIFERAEPDPISSDRRHQAHPLRAGSGVASPTAPTPHAGAVGVEATPDAPRGSSWVRSGGLIRQ